MRHFEIYSVQPAGPAPQKIFSGSPSAAAKKAMTALCKLRDAEQCTLTITVREIKRTMVNGEYTNVPVIDSDGIEIMRKYKLKRSTNETPVSFKGADPILFKHKVEITESFGRVL
jgi:hypothetical protein